MVPSSSDNTVIQVLDLAPLRRVLHDRNWALEHVVVEVDSVCQGWNSHPWVDSFPIPLVVAASRAILVALRPDVPQVPGGDVGVENHVASR